MDLQFTGTVENKLDAEVISDKFKKRVLVLNDGHDTYPQSIAFEFTQSNIDKLDNVNVGDRVTVHFNLRGREYNGKYYVSVQGWKVDPLESVTAQTIPTPHEQKQENIGADESDDLPF